MSLPEDQKIQDRPSPTPETSVNGIIAVQPGSTGLSGPAIPASGKWLALTAALLGWMFDGLEMGLFPLVASPALQDLLGVGPGSSRIGLWFGVATAAFLIGAATGGVLFGWLGDRLGRVRAMTLSVLTYAIFSGLCGVASSAEQVVVLRFSRPWAWAASGRWEWPW